MAQNRLPSVVAVKPVAQYFKGKNVRSAVVEVGLSPETANGRMEPNLVIHPLSQIGQHDMRTIVKFGQEEMLVFS